MNKRQYNIFYHLHTVSSIVLTVLLYIIFFAGTFSFFRDEIVNWERGDVVTTEKGLGTSVNTILEAVSDTMILYGRDITIARLRDENIISVSLKESKDTTLSKEERTGSFFYVDTDNLEQANYYETYTVGEFLYRLHFLDQIRVVGRYLSSTIGLFLVFIVLTGLLVHWKKVVSNFYLFRPKKKLKNVWKEAHTVLGTIGLPFQFIYGLTGAFFFLRIIILSPTVLFLYDGDQDKLFEDIGMSETNYEFSNYKIDKRADIDDLITSTQQRWEEFNVDHLHIYNYGDSAMHVSIDGYIPKTKKFTGYGSIVYNIFSGQEKNIKSPYRETTYTVEILNYMDKLHVGDYAGLEFRIVCFVLGLCSCFVIISGILIWIDARLKQKISVKRKSFNQWIGHIYLAICLSMYPITAAIFILAKLIPVEYLAKKYTIYYSFYFIGWLALALFFSLKKNNRFTNKYTLISGGLLGLLIPMVSFLSQKGMSFITNPDFLLVNLVWLIIGLTTLVIGLRLKNK